MNLTVLAAIGGFGVVISAMISGPYSTEPRSCAALEPWLSETRAHIAASDALFRQIQAADFDYNMDAAAILAVFGTGFHSLSDKQYAMTPPPGFTVVNDSVAYAFDEYGDVIDSANALGFILGLFGGAAVYDEDEIGSMDTALLVSNGILDLFEGYIDLYGGMSAGFEAVISDDLVCGGAAPIPPGRDA